nr:putative defensin Tcis59 [Tityus cisandinus]
MKMMKAIGVLLLISILFCTLEVTTVEAERGCPNKPEICDKYCRRSSPIWVGGYCAGPVGRICICHR